MQGISSATAAIFPGIAPGLKPMDAGETAALLKQTNIDNVIGNIFEGALIRAGGVSPYDPDRPNANDTFDFPAGLGGTGAERCHHLNLYRENTLRQASPPLPVQVSPTQYSK